MIEIIDKINRKQRRITDAKFFAWDKVIDREYLAENRHVRYKEYAYSLLKDPTIYTYAFDRHYDGAPFKLYPYQDMIINDQSKRIAFCAANQIGKSVTLCMKGKHFALRNHGTTTLMISKTLPQCKDLLRQISNSLKSSILEYSFDTVDTETKTEISFNHFREVIKDGKKKTIELPTSRIICVPATEAALGYAAHLVLIDELAFFENGRHFYYQIAQPRTYATKGQIVVFSNPNGEQGIFWELWNDEDFSRYKFNYLAKPENTIPEYEKLRIKLTRDKFESTVDAVFTSPEGGFISVEERKAMQEDRPNVFPSALTEPIFIFFDWGKARDRTVRASGCVAGTNEFPGVKVKEMKEYPHRTAYNLIIQELEDLIQVVGLGMIAGVGWDNSGVGKGLEDFVKRIQYLGIPLFPVEFSLPNKSRIYTLFKLLIERNLQDIYGIRIPYVPECDKQLSTLRFKRTGRGYLQVHHQEDRDRDDYPDALAGLCSLIIKPDYAPVTVEIIGGEETSKLNKLDICPHCESSYIEPEDERCSLCGKEV